MLTLILSRTDISEIAGYFKRISLSNILLAFLVINIAQFFSAMRMRYFFEKSNFPLSIKYSFILFSVGGFYNFLLPGGIGGDAYKVILARKRMEMPTAQGIRIMIADRASGLCVIILIMLTALYLIDINHYFSYANIILLFGALINIAAYLFASNLLLKQSCKNMLLSLPYSLIVQSLWVLSLYFLWESLGNGINFSAYIVLYAASSIASMLPISVGGLGIREMTYFYGAALISKYTGISVDGELGVALSLCIFALSFFSSLIGLFWLNKVTHSEINKN